MGNYQSGSVSVQNLAGCSLYRYEPCTVLPERADLTKNKIQPSTLETNGLRGERGYSYETVSDAQTLLPELLDFLQNDTSDGVKSYLQMESAYREFVYSYALTVPAEFRAQLGAVLDQCCESYGPADSLTKEQAQTAALDAANIDAADADISSATLSEVAGVTCYKVEFTSGNHTYAYSINAESGEVLEASYRDKNAAPTDSAQTDTTASGATTTPAQTTPNINTSTGAVDEAKAQEIALAHAGVKAADATITKSKLDYDDGRQVYEIEWYANGAKYDYEIDAATGKIVSYDYDAENYTPSQSTNTNANVKISEATAKQTALARVPGATAANIYKFKLDFDDGRWEYEGEIRYGTMEYDFTIDANTGAIIEWDMESIYD